MSTEKSTLNRLFCLEGLLLDRFDVKDTAIDLYVRSPRTRAVCQACNTSTGKVHDDKIRVIKHMISDDKIVYLKLTSRKFVCRNAACNRFTHTFTETIPGIDRRHTSNHYRQSMVLKIRDRSFSSVAKEHAVSTRSLISATRNIHQLAGLSWPTEPFALGVDEHSFSGRDLMITLTDLTHHRLIGILLDDRLDTLTDCLQNLPQQTKNLITSACIDMKEGYRVVLKKIFPDIPIVIDKFHVVSHLNFLLGGLRLLYTSHSFHLPKKLLERNQEDLSTDDRKNLEIIFKRYPPIAELWRIKEIIRQIYRIKDPRLATARFDSLLDGLRGDVRRRWQLVFKTLSRWRPYILNYFHTRITNAYTEGIHTRIKLLKRISYGFRNKFNYIAKMTIAFLPIAALLTHIHSSTYLS